MYILYNDDAIPPAENGQSLTLFTIKSNYTFIIVVKDRFSDDPH